MNTNYIWVRAGFKCQSWKPMGMITSLPESFDKCRLILTELTLPIQRQTLLWSVLIVFAWCLLPFHYWDILEVVWRLWSAVKGSGSTKSSISPFTIYYLTRTPRISWKMRINSQICHHLPITRSWRWGLTRRSRRWLLGTRASRSCWRCSRTRERVRWNDVKNKEERKNNAEESWLRERRTMLKRKYYFFKRWN